MSGPCMRFSRLSLLVFALLMLPGTGFAAAGKFIFVHGNVLLVDQSATERKARRGMDLNEGDKIITGEKGRAQIRMKDGAMLAIRPQTELLIEEYAHNEPGRKESSVVSLLKGTFRSVTGAIGRENSEAYEVKTPVATIGIRGTDHEPMYIPPGTPGGVQPGAYDKVNRGGTVMRTDAGTIELRPGQVGFAGGRDQSPTTLPEMPEFYTQSTETGGEEEEGTESAADSEESSGTSEEESDTTSEAGGTTEESSEGTEDASSGETSESGTTENSDGTTDSTATEETSDPTAGGETTDGTTTDTTESPSTTTTSTTGGTGDTTTTVTTTTEPTTTLVATNDTVGTADLTNQTLTDSSGDVTSIETIATFYNAPGMVAAGTWQGDDFDSVTAHLAWEPLGHIGYDASGNLVSANDYEVDSHIQTFQLNSPRNGTWQRAPSYTTTGITYGRVQGDSIYVTGVDDISGPYSQTFNLSNNQYFHWVTGAMPFPEYMPMIFRGTISYVLDGGTAPTDHYGNSGVLNSASISADFTNMVASFGLSASVSGITWSAAGSAAIEYDEFWASTWDGNLSIANDYPSTNSYDGNLVAGFTGKSLGGAFLTYTFNDIFSNSISGVAALRAISTPSTAIDHRMIIWSAYDTSQNRPYMAGGYHRTDEITYSGGIVGFRTELWEVDYDQWVKFSYSGTPTDVGGDADLGIVWGRWAGAANVTDLDNTALSNSPTNLHYLAGPVMNEPVALPTSGTYTYSFVGGTRPTDNHGNVGVAPSASDFSLVADFTNLTVDVSAQASVAGLTLRGSASNVPLEGHHFEVGGDHGGVNLSVTCLSGCAAGETTKGGIVGGFAGSTGQAAGISYVLGKTGGTETVITGVAAFKR